MSAAKRAGSTGIYIRHVSACASRRGERCNCRLVYQANVWSERERKRIRRTFSTLAAAKAWRQDALVALRKGTMRAPLPTTLREAAAALVAGSRDGSIRNRSGDLYKPSTVRGYQASLNGRVLPELGALRIGDVTRADVQALADRMLAEGKDPSTIRNTLMPLRAIFRRAVSRGEVSVTPDQRRRAASRVADAVIESPHRRRPPSSSARLARPTVPSGRQRSTRACVAAS